jgi:phosphotransferase system  glucose/maltose/N-acetylglucosamine-specific IIC component
LPPVPVIITTLIAKEDWPVIMDQRRFVVIVMTIILLFTIVGFITIILPVYHLLAVNKNV